MTILPTVCMGWNMVILPQENKQIPEKKLVKNICESTKD